MAFMVDHTLIVNVLKITVIDLVLSGDNAVVIAMAVRSLPKDIARKASIFGAGAAVALRIAFTAAAALLLHVPFLQAVGGAILFWIAYKLLIEEEEGEERPGEIRDFWEAVRIIVLADLVMSLDNILAVGGASEGNLALMLFGLALSIPLVLFGVIGLARPREAALHRPRYAEGRPARGACAVASPECAHSCRSLYSREGPGLAGKA